MPVDVDKTLRQALSNLTRERQRIDRQISALQDALSAEDGPRRGQPRRQASIGRATRRVKTAGPKRGRRRMSAAARKAVSARMKAYWAKRRGRGAKKATVGKKSTTKEKE